MPQTLLAKSACTLGNAWIIAFQIRPSSSLQPWPSAAHLRKKPMTTTPVYLPALESLSILSTRLQYADASWKLGIVPFFHSKRSEISGALEVGLGGARPLGDLGPSGVDSGVANTTSVPNFNFAPILVRYSGLSSPCISFGDFSPDLKFGVLL